MCWFLSIIYFIVIYLGHTPNPMKRKKPSKKPNRDPNKPKNSRSAYSYFLADKRDEAKRAGMKMVCTSQIIYIHRQFPILYIS